MEQVSVFLLNFKKNHRYSFFFLSWLLIFGLCILVRLPHFLSRNFYFDGDEAIVGIMGQDWANLKAFPTFFYGQSYGFCVFEAWAVAFWLKIVGTGIWALRLGGLSLYSLGIALTMHGLLRRNLSLRWVMIFAFLLITFPAWLLWGAMVRGGYVMSFATVAGIFYLLSRHTLNFWRFFLIGALGAIAYQSHILILIPLLPLFLFDLVKARVVLKTYAWMAVGFIVGVLVIKFSDFYYNGWDAPRMFFHHNTLEQAFVWNGQNLVEIFGGFYFYNAFLEVPFWWRIGLIICLLLYFGYLVFSIRFQKYWVTILWFIAMLFVVAITGFFGVYSPRYLLGFFMGLFFFCLYVFVNKTWQKGVLIALCVVQLTGIFVGSKLKREWYPNGQNQLEALEAIHKVVVERGKKAVFVTDNLGQWQWNYLYGDQIPATAFRRVERVMRFAEKGYTFYDKNPNDVALIGLWGVFWGMDSLKGFNDHRFQVAEKYYYMDQNIDNYIHRGENTAD